MHACHANAHNGTQAHARARILAIFPVPVEENLTRVVHEVHMLAVFKFPDTAFLSEVFVTDILPFLTTNHVKGCRKVLGERNQRKNCLLGVQ